MRLKKVKDLKKQYKPNVKIERTKREHTKVIVKLPKHLRHSKSLKQILKQKFVHHRKHKKKHIKSIMEQNQLQKELKEDIHIN